MVNPISWVSAKWSDYISGRVDLWISDSTHWLRMIDEDLGTSLAETYRTSFKTVFTPIVRSYLKTSVPVSYLAATVIALLWLGLLSAAMYAAFEGEFFPGSLTIRLLLAIVTSGLSGYWVMKALVYAVQPIYAWIGDQNAEYFTFYYVTAALRSLSKGDSRVTVERLNSAAASVKHLTVRAQRGSDEARAAVKQKTELIAGKLHELQTAIALPTPTTLQDTTNTLLDSLRSVLEGNYGAMPTGSIEAVSRGRTQQVRSWMLRVLGAVAVGSVLGGIAFLLTGMETDVDKVVNAENTAGYIGLLIYAGAALNVVRAVSPSAVEDIGVKELVARPK